MTFTRYIKKSKEQYLPTGYKAIAQTKAVFFEMMETDLARHIINLADMFHGLSVNKCCILAYNFASSNKIVTPQNG